MYDEDPDGPPEPWFAPARPDPSELPAAREDPFFPDESLGPRPAARADWAAAQGLCLVELLEAAEAAARVCERLALAPGEVRQRLVLEDVAALARIEDGWLGSEALALYRAQRLAPAEDAQRLWVADWAVRRLLGARRPQDDWGGFMGLAGPPRPAPGWLDGGGALHPLTWSCAIFHTARRVEGPLLEKVVLAWAAAQPEARPRVPPGLGLCGAAALTGGGAPSRRLRLWLGAVRDGMFGHLRTLEALRLWRARAEEATADLSGATPPRLVAACLAHPVLSAAMAAQATGASPAGARRNLALFEARGLIRETTGQSRYRFWTLAL